MKKTSVILKFRSSLRNPDFGVLVFHVTRHRKTTTSTTPYLLRESEWDSTVQTVVYPENVSSKRRKELSSLRSKLKKELLSLNETAGILESRGDYSSRELVKCFRERQQGQLFCSYINSKVENLRSAGKFGTAHAHQYSSLSFLKYLGGRDIHISKIDAVLIENYERHLLSMGKSRNTVSCYMRSLRASYNSAVREKVIGVKKNVSKPFSGVFTGNAKTAKRAIGVESIGKIVTAELVNTGQPTPNVTDLSFSRDLFLFSFYTRGMSFTDMANLKKENINGNKIVYHRQKTGQSIAVELENCMREIINRYADPNSPYVFPIHKDAKEGFERWKRTQTALAAYNRSLKRLTALTEINENLTGYVARHSWATIASHEGIPLSTISRSMGHESEKTTRIYISNVDNSDLGKANRLVLSRIAVNVQTAVA